ncbi:MAG: imidazoleglycerol-phosphate dehydratase HisB [Longicatena sp.]
MRTAVIKRTTKESDIDCRLDLDGTRIIDIETGIGFFDHMVTLLAFHAQMDLTLQATGDLDVCDHHCVEDCGIVLGNAIKEALGDKMGIERYGSVNLPMDETLANVTLDISGRSYLVFNATFKRESIGNFSCEMVEEFFRALANQAGITLHVNVYYGRNDHHQIEAIFKAFGRALRQAIQVSGTQLPSSKGML